jgi:hypothetical protein
MTKREAITLFRKEVQERSADSTFTNKDLYLCLLKQAKWLIKREVSAGRIYRNNSVFRTLSAREVVETSTIPSCLSVKTNCKIYRTKNVLPDMWQDNNGPVIKNVNSIDNSTSFTLISPNQWQNKINDPYQKYSSEKYAFFADGYLWFPKDNPNYVNIVSFYKDDIRLVKEDCSECDDKKTGCVRFLDTEFMVPDWVEAELFSKALQLLFPTKQTQEDQQIDKNTTRKN